jgi:hypothetical protein
MKEISLTGFDEGTTTTVGSLTANLGELIGAMMESGRSLIAVAEFCDHRYVQFAVGTQGDVIGEVISNLNIGDLVALSFEAEEELRALGFHEPSPGPNPNWWMAANSRATLVRLLNMMNRAIYFVLKESSGNEVEVRTWGIEIPCEMDRQEFRTVSRIHYQELHGS